MLAVDPNHRITDPAWKSYRLKGTLDPLREPRRVPTLLGSSINEGGFVNTASCISCTCRPRSTPPGQSNVPGCRRDRVPQHAGDRNGDLRRPARNRLSLRPRRRTSARFRPIFVWSILFAQDRRRRRNRQRKSQTPYRHPREGGEFINSVADPIKHGRLWMPACAGMTAVGDLPLHCDMSQKQASPPARRTV